MSAPEEPERPAEEILAAGVAELGLRAPADVVECMARYLREIEAWNPTLGLVKASGAELVVRHVLDSLAGAPAFRGIEAGSVVVDVGSGAGLPGIPLAAAYPDLRFVLLDRSSRRCTFLEQCVAVLGMRNASVFRGEARSFPGPAAAVTFRAVSPIEPHFLRSTGILDLAPLVIAYKGTMERTRAEIETVRGLYASVDVVALRVPFLDGERTLAVLRR